VSPPPSPPEPRDRDRGQASLEWLAVVALVAGLLALGAGLAQAEGVGRRVTREMARALCLVSGGDCHRDQEPCVEASTSDTRSLSGGFLIFRLGRDLLAVVKRRSDGTYAVSVGHGWSGGAEGEAGFDVGVDVAGLDISAGASLTASLLAQLKDTKTWIVGSEAEAEAIVSARGASRPPDLSSSDRAWVPSGNASVDLEVEGLADLNAASVALSDDQHAGTVTDHRTGRQTTYIDAQLSASSSALEGVLTASTRDAREIYAVERAPDGRPLTLQIIATGAYGSSRDLPSVVQPVVGRLEAPGAERYEVTATLDLSDPAALQATAQMLDDIAHKRGRARPSAALKELVASRGTVEARILAADTSSDETSGKLAIGTRIGQFAKVSEHGEQRLLAAASRGLDGQWIARDDCVR
jgi:hypothetical protein